MVRLIVKCLKSNSFLVSNLTQKRRNSPLVSTVYQTCDTAILRVCHGRRTLETILQFAPAGIDPIAETALVEEEMTRDTDGVVPVPGAKALLDSIPSDRLAIVTSATRSMAEARLHLVGLPTPAILITAEDVAVGKPNPEGYRRAARELGYDASETLVLEDAPAGLMAGHAAGAYVIAVATHLGADMLGSENRIPDFTGLTVEKLQRQWYR